MRDYSKVIASFWTGDTGKALRRRGPDAMLVALYLMTSPTSNMLGLYYQPTLYMAHETGLGLEGATKGLRDAIDVGFCQYDEATEMVWVIEMARYQIGDALKASDKRSAGVQNAYDALPSNPFLGPFFDRYGDAFCMSHRRGVDDLFSLKPPEAPSKPLPHRGNPPESASPPEAPSKPLASQEQEQEQERDKPPPSSGALPAPLRVALPTSPPDFDGENEDKLNGKAIVKLSDTFDIPESWGVDALALGFARNEVLFEAEKFKQYWTRGKGAGKRRNVRGWRQSWSNWLAKAAKEK